MNALTYVYHRNNSDTRKQMTTTRASAVNSLSQKELLDVMTHLKNSNFRRLNRIIPYVELTDRGWRCNLKTTRRPDNTNKYPQIDLNRFSNNWNKRLGKQLVHLIWWRATNDGALIDPTMEISHRDMDSTILSVVQEAKEINESRKYCHAFNWYKCQPNEHSPRCPHWEHPCTGP